MTALADLKALLDRATEPSRELDARLHIALYGWKLSPVPADADGKNAGEVYTPDGKPPGNGFTYPHKGAIHPHYHVPDVRYTASLDAATQLCERLLPGWYWGAGNNPYASPQEAHSAWVTSPEGRGPGKLFAPTPALALCRAIVTALAAKEGA